LDSIDWTNIRINCDSIDTAISWAAQASFWEVSSYPKPGNVNPSQTVKSMSYFDFLKAIDAIFDQYHKIFRKSESIGSIIYQTTQAMMNAQSKGNVLLGHILLFSPLLQSLSDLLKKEPETNPRTWDHFWKCVEAGIYQATPQDGVWFYRAVILSRAGGLTKPGGIPYTGKYDFMIPNIEQKILADQRKFKDLFQESASFDSISHEYVTTFGYCRKLVKDWLLIESTKYSTINDLTVDLFLTILSQIPDSLIYRKTNAATAEAIRKQAQSICSIGGISTANGRESINKLNIELLDRGLNPGTSADLTACTLFLGKLFGLFSKAIK
jgi:triphosphoribosyl-dephospho-CoA synthase